MNPLQIFPKHPSAPDTYYIGGGWSPACITAVDKRFSPGELAAEYWKAKERCMFVSAFSGWTISPDSQLAKQAEVLHRFATLPHYDENPA